MSEVKLIDMPMPEIKRFVALGGMMPVDSAVGHGVYVQAVDFDKLAQAMASRDSEDPSKVTDQDGCPNEKAVLKRHWRSSKFDYDALAQQMAASQARLRFAHEQFEIAGTQADEAQATITRLEAMAAERDKEIAEAVEVIKNTRRSLEKANDGEVISDTVWLDAAWSETLFDYLDAYLSRHEEKANDC